jgi:hypothetical protein
MSEGLAMPEFMVALCGAEFDFFIVGVALRQIETPLAVEAVSIYAFSGSAGRHYLTSSVGGSIFSNFGLSTNAGSLL